ncbi:MAG: PAS domain-containing protein [Candidatus Sericytochromatia bacterium]|nr:PAS domain-containing protein [Candidatus Tanganyikabacteria bacterium]
MAAKEIELILTRQLASYLAMPIFVVSPDGRLLFYNEEAERLLGVRFDETGEMSADAWATSFSPADGDGAPLAAEDLPLMHALRTRQPAHRRFWITGQDANRREIEVSAFPLIGQADRFLGAIAVFWEAARA